mmetsp:Transcript_127/g.345  ORF Transcript_127/g.345 Transcript_127/m.345 type:complete len:635 (-) Transcript_127:151-2055(-)
MSGLTLEITEGITEHANRVALKGVFAAFGDVLACWVPPIDRRGIDNASVRFANAQSADAAKGACDAGQVFFQGLPLKVKWRIGGGPRVGNSDIGSAAGGRSPSRERGRQREEYRNRRSRSRRRRSRSRDRKLTKRSRSRDREKRFDKEVPAVQDAPQPQAMPPPAFNEALMDLPARPANVPLDVAVTAAFGGGAAATTALSPAGSLPSLPPVIDVIDPEAEKKRKKEAAEAREKRQAQLKRGPGVAALVQGALKRAQTMAKEKEEERELDEERLALEKLEREEQERKEQEQRERKRREEKAREREEAQEAKKKPEIPPEVLKAEQEKKEREAREKAEREARESAERARREAEEADARAKMEQATREARVRAGVETAKRQQAARQAAQKDSLYGDMPDVGRDEELAEKRAREAQQLQRNINLSLPAEDKSKIVFLDIDGVLRPARAGGFDILATETVNPDTTDFFPAAMAALRHIIERTGAVIVLSSEWRRTEPLQDAVDQVLERHRLRPCYSATTTKVAESKDTSGDPVRTFAERRAREISAWLRQHDQEVKGWVVLDDINLALADEDKRPSSEERKIMGSKLVQTWPLCGLTMGNAKTAVRILNGEMIHKVLVERPKAPGGGIAQTSANASGH